jgi:hypothetical protein
MYRRAVLPLIAVAALVSLIAVVLPTGATGEERLGSDTYVFGHDATIEQPINGSLQVYNGNVVIANVIAGDLLVAGGAIKFLGAGRVDGNLIYVASRVEGMKNDEHDRVRGHIYPLMSLEGAAASINKSAIIASLLLVWLVVGVIVTLMNGREVRLSSAEVRTSALHCFVLGLVALTSFVLTAIAFSYLVPYVIGIPLLAALGVFGLLTKVYGMIALFHAIGTIAAGARSREQLAARKWLRGDLAMVIIGLVILGGIRFIPVVGTIAWALASIFGVGVALATRFGRREPWFLAFRAAEA